MKVLGKMHEATEHTSARKMNEQKYLKKKHTV